MSHWEERQSKKYLASEKKVDEYYKGLVKAFEQAKKEIHKVTNDFVMRYAVENEVNTYKTALRKLNKTELGDLQSFMNLAIANLNEYNQEVNNLSIKARITRYQALEMQIDAILQQLYGIEYQHKGEQMLKDVYSEAYYRTWYSIDAYKGFHAEFAQVNALTVEELIKYPFNGANFSDRLWKQKDHMLSQLTESITTMLVQGRHPKTLTKEFAKKFGKKEFEAKRLLYTEGAFMIEQGTLEAYKEDGVDKYQILATLDYKTSQICQDQDNEIYLVSEYKTGVNAPPFHPFCRTTTTPYYDDMETGTRIAKNSKGKNITVSANMKYSEWKEVYVKNDTD
jgi:SPP1 gp7 family putative phage head morphogenesis protein